eukprot:1139743-Pelagomonas_calceolata.AAC.4
MVGLPGRVRGGGRGSRGRRGGSVAATSIDGSPLPKKRIGRPPKRIIGTSSRGAGAEEEPEVGRGPASVRGTNSRGRGRRGRGRGRASHLRVKEEEEDQCAGAPMQDLAVVLDMPTFPEAVTNLDHLVVDKNNRGVGRSVLDC